MTMYFAIYELVSSYFILTLLQRDVFWAVS